jgi:hypothetical protein
MRTPNEIINEIQSAIAEETTKGIYSDSTLRVTDILQQVQEEAYTEGETQAVQRERETAKAVVEAGQAVIARWDTPLWKDVEHTGVSINKLRRALATYNDNSKG